MGGNYFYGRITKSGKKLLINVPTKKTEFEYDRLVKVFLLPQDIIESELETELNATEQVDKVMGFVEASRIIKDLDPNYDFNGKSGDDVKEYAKKLNNHT